MSTRIDSMLSEYVTTGKQPSEDVFMMDSICQKQWGITWKGEAFKSAVVGELSLEEQFRILSSVSNYHWWSYPRIGKGGIEGRKPNVTFQQQVYIAPYMWMGNAENQSKPPQSPRLRIMYYINSAHILDPIVINVLSHDREGKSVLAEEETMIVDDPRPQVRPQTPRKVGVTRQNFSKVFGLKEKDGEMESAGRLGQYDMFKQYIVSEEGVIQWREHTEDRDVIVMSDVNAITGKISPTKFVHVTSVKVASEWLTTCTCESYGIIAKASMHDNPHLQAQDLALDEKQMTCMHCLYYHDVLQGAWEGLGEEETSAPQRKILDGFSSMTEPVVLLGSVLPKSSTKFSVAGNKGGDYAIVHVSFTGTTCWVNCQNGLCDPFHQNKKKIPKSISVKEEEKLCPHLKVIWQKRHQEQLHGIFPRQFAGGDPEKENLEEGDGNIEGEEGEEGEEVEEVEEEEDSLNTEDDADISSELGEDVVFNTETGLWNYPAKSKHQPCLDMSGESLAKYVRFFS